MYIKTIFSNIFFFFFSKLVFIILLYRWVLWKTMLVWNQHFCTWKKLLHYDKEAWKFVVEVIYYNFKQLTVYTGIIAADSGSAAA